MTASRQREVLFVCVENACRSLMAEAIFNAHPPKGWRAASAGTRPTKAANPRTSTMLAEIGLRSPEHAPQLLTAKMVDGSDVRVTMGCLDDVSCPARLKALELRDWELPDPARLDDEGFRRVRDEIIARVLALAKELGRADPSPPPPAGSSAR
jgi:protein-tyrosine-phosphatase